jgi:hypothetical protein
MPKYYITQTVNYAGTVEADTEEQARDYFVQNAHTEFYDSVESEDIEEEEEDEEEED